MLCVIIPKFRVRHENWALPGSGLILFQLATENGFYVLLLHWSFQKAQLQEFELIPVKFEKNIFVKYAALPDSHPYFFRT